MLPWGTYEWPVVMYRLYGRDIWKVARGGFGDLWSTVCSCSYTPGVHMRGARVISI